MLKLIGVLTSGIPAIVAAILAFITRKAGTAAGSIAAFVLLTTAFIACINTILNTVLTVMTVPAWISSGVGMFVPGNFTACLSAIMSAKICRSAYDLAMEKVRAINNAS